MLSSYYIEVLGTLFCDKCVQHFSYLEALKDEAFFKAEVQKGNIG